MVKPALHTRTRDSTPLQQVLEVVRRTGRHAIELRRVDFDRALDRGHSAYVQDSGVPIGPIDLEMTPDRLRPGRGTIAFDEVFRLLAAKSYDGPIRYEAPNPAARAPDPEDVDGEARAATLAFMP
jgi:sugar phosphate isomerase/epimerase